MRGKIDITDVLFHSYFLVLLDHAIPVIIFLICLLASSNFYLLASSRSSIFSSSTSIIVVSGGGARQRVPSPESEDSYVFDFLTKQAQQQK